MEAVGTTTANLTQTSYGRLALAGSAEDLGGLPGIAGWIERPWVFPTVLALIAGIYLASVTPNWSPTPDSALYLMLGDNLAHGQGYTLWGKPHVHVPPGFPLLLAGLDVVGIDSTLGRNIVMMLLAWGALAFIYLALRELVSTALARWLVLLVAVSHVMHLNSVRLLSDIPFMAILWLGLWCQLRGLRTRRWTLELGSCLLLGSCMIRVAGVLIVVGAALGVLLQQSPISRKRLWINGGGMILCIFGAVGAASVYVFLRSDEHALPSYFESAPLYLQRMWQAGMNRTWANLLKTSEELSTLFTGQTNHAIRILNLFFWIPAVTGIVVCWKRKNFFGVCVLACYLLPLMLLRPVISRYLLPMAPLLWWYALEGIRWFGDRTLQWQPRGRRIAITCAVLLLLLNLPKAGKLAYRLHNPKIDNAYHEDLVRSEVATYLKNSASSRQVFISNDEGRILSYLSGRWTVPMAESQLRYYWRTKTLLEDINIKSVSHVVLKQCGKPLRDQQLASLISSYPQAELVFELENYKVFRIEPVLAPSDKNRVAASATRESN